MLPDNLPAPHNGFSDTAKSSLKIYCIEGLCELARREAWQMAFCHTRFLRMTTSPSNIAMDGRLMDFNGLSCLFIGDYPVDFGYQLRLSEMWKEPIVLQQGLSDLCLYLGKYLFDHEFTLVARQKIDETFQNVFYEANYYCYLEQLGVPTKFLAGKNIPDVLKQMVNSFVTLVNNRGKSLFNRDADGINDSPLQRLVLELIYRSQKPVPPGINSAENDAQLNETLRSFSRGIQWLMQVGSEHNTDDPHFLKQMECHSRERLQSRKCLGKLFMNEKITELLDEYGDDTHSLREAISDMENRMLRFSKVALGHIAPVHFPV